MPGALIKQNKVVAVRAHRRVRSRPRKRIPLHRMTVDHLFNTVRMIFNHTVPRAMALLPFRPYPVGGWPRERRIVRVGQLLEELKKRPNIPTSYMEDLAYMARIFKEQESRLRDEFDPAVIAYLKSGLPDHELEYGD